MREFITKIFYLTITITIIYIVNNISGYTVTFVEGMILWTVLSISLDIHVIKEKLNG